MFLQCSCAALGCFMLFASVNINCASNPWAFELSIIHLNDFHDRYEEISPSGATCKGDKCIGGFSRMYSAITQLKGKLKNPIVLNAGDNFQGSFWYTLYKWNVTQHFFNLLPCDAYTLGNHEFDNGVEGVLPFIKAMRAPIVVANIDSSKEKLFQGAINKSIVLERNGRRIGIIGVIGRDTKRISKPGYLEFFDEIDSVNKEAIRMVAEDNVDTIIVLSHCGLQLDKLIAQNASSKIGLIVGGHSHTLLYTGKTLPGPDKRYGEYPAVVTQANGRKVLVVQASAYSKYIGHISVRYDVNGDVISWNGNTIYLNGSIAQNERINEEIREWKKEVDAFTGRIVGSTNTDLNYKTCRYAECTLGNFVTDAMLFNEKEATIALLASEGLRVSIPKGAISYGDISLALPFRNTFDTLQLQGVHLKELLEYVAGTHNETTRYQRHLMSVAGIRVAYNITKPVGSRIVTLQVRLLENNEYVYTDLNVSDIYSIVVDEYTIDADEGNPILNAHMLNRKTGKIDSDALLDYLKSESPITTTLERRVTVST